MAFQSSIRISLLGLMVATVGSAGASSTSSACKCSDVPSMRDRISEAQTAISAYRTAMPGMSPTQQFTNDHYAKLQADVQSALNGYRTANPRFRSNAARTDASCEIQINPGATPCLREALQAHERIHQKSCQDKKQWVIIEIITGKLDWKQKMMLREVAQEEVDGYQAEIDYLNKTLKSAQQDCPVALSRYETNDQRLAQRERVRRSVRRVSDYAATI